MGRLFWTLVLVGACSYRAPSSEVGSGDDQQREDAAPEPDVAPLPDVPVVPPDTMPADGPPSPQTSDIVSSADNYLDAIGLSQNSNFGGGATMFVDASPAAVALLRFDLSGLAPATEVQSVELHVFVSDVGGTVNVFPMLESWTETTSSWNRRNTNTLWMTEGAGPPSRGTTAIGTFSPSTFGEKTVMLDTATVQAWVTNPDANLGIVMFTSSTDGSQYRSRQAANGKPFLRITHLP